MPDPRVVDAADVDPFDHEQVLRGLGAFIPALPWSTLRPRMAGSNYGRLEAQLERAIAAELSKLDGATGALNSVAWGTLDGTAAPMRQVAIVAADAGNVRLRFTPLRIAFVRVASSAQDAPLGELVFPSELPSAELVALLRAELPGLLGPLDAAGLDTDRLLASADARRDRVAAVREVLEWGAVLAAMGARHAQPVLVVRDGLLRSIHFDTASFDRLRSALVAVGRSTGNRLVAIAKSTPGGADLVNALLLGGVLDRRPDAAVAWLRIPPELERDLLPGSFVVGRRMGPLVLVRAEHGGRFVPIEVADDDPTSQSIAVAVATLFTAQAEYWPEPGMPVEVAIAHERARISALDREWMHRAFLDRLARHSPRLSRRASAAEVLGAGGTIITEEPE